MNCILLTTTSERAKCEMLEKSLNKYEWQYHIIEHHWRGFGDKILRTYEYLKQHPEITHFFYTDAWDTIVVNYPKWALHDIVKYFGEDCIVLSAEKGCYPHPDKAPLYPEVESPFKYVNGGGWFCNAELFCRMVDENPLTPETVDQVWFTDLYLKYHESKLVKLDTECEVFQTIAFCEDWELEEMEDNGREYIWNFTQQSEPTFLHGNGHTPMTRFYELI